MKKTKPPGSSLSHSTASKKVKPQEGWPDEDKMEEHFPGFDDFLRDLRQWMLEEITDSTIVKDNVVADAVSRGIFAGLRKWGGGQETRDSLFNFHLKMEAKRE